MTWKHLLAILLRCELKAQHDHFGNWNISAKGALAVILVALSVVVIWGKGFG